jgi:hypothetical protein
MLNKPAGRSLVAAGMAILILALISLRTCGESPDEILQDVEKPFPEYPGMSWDERLKNDDLSGNIDADRELSKEDRTFITRLSDYLIDKNYDWGDRVSAARWLGVFGHRDGIPALLAVMRDENDMDEVRRHAAKSLSMILDKRNVRYLIENGLGSDNATVQLQAWEDLPQMVGGPDEFYSTQYRTFYKPPPEDEEQLKEYIDVWLKWWKKHSKSAKLSRINRGGF